MFDGFFRHIYVMLNKKPAKPAGFLFSLFIF